MRYRLRTLLILLALGPPMLATLWLFVLPLTPKTYGDAVLIGSINGTAVLVALVLLQWELEVAAKRCQSVRNRAAMVENRA
jgi:hypothetical protein